MIIACVGDISKLQLNIWSSYGLLAEIKKFFSLSSPLFCEVYAQSKSRETVQVYPSEQTKFLTRISQKKVRNIGELV
jgi:hypothetical protein